MHDKEIYRHAYMRVIEKNEEGEVPCVKRGEVPSELKCE